MKKLKLISLILAVVMLVSMLPMAGMLSAFAAEGDQPVADDDWYTRETTDDTPTVLEINNQDDLFAFAEKLSEGTSAAPAFVVVDEETGVKTQLTVKLNTNIILNAGWNAMTAVEPGDGPVTAPAVSYPISANAFFGGIFDGQGHVLSGLYVNDTTYLGFFGNVPTGYTATVQNVIIANSFIQGNAQAVGSIFGAIDERPLGEPDATGTYAPTGTTKGIINNVYVEATVSNTGTGKKNLGSGGFVGGVRAELEVTNSAFVGQVFGGVRGCGGVVGSTYTKIVSLSGAYGNNYWNPTNATVSIENVYVQAHLVAGNASTDHQGACGGIIGYMNGTDEDVIANNVVLNCTFDTEEMADDGQGGKKKVYEQNASFLDTEFATGSGTWNTDNGKLKDLDTDQVVTGTLVETRKTIWRSGYLFAHTYSKGKGAKNAVVYDATNDQSVYGYLEWTINNVYYVKNAANGLKYESAYYNRGAEGIVTINGVLMDASYNTETGEVPSELFAFTNWNEYKAAVEAKKTNSDVQIPVLKTNIAEIGYDGEVRTYNGEVQYAHSGEIADQLLRNYFDDHCALTADAASNWATTLTEQMTGLDATQWVVRGDIILPVALNDMVAANAEAMDVAGETPVADPDWYANETANDNKDLAIYNADDLLAFAEAINAGHDFAGMTITLLVNVTLNEGWNAFAKTEATLTGDATSTEKAVTAASLVWPVGAGKFFAGTFDGNGKTISGIYQVVADQNVGIFGNVNTAVTATIKNLAIVNSYVRGGQGTGGLFGVVDPAAGDVNTKAVVENVLANINVDSGYVSTALGGSNYNTKSNRSNGTGGLFGACRASVEVTNTAFIGEVYGGHLRGLSAIAGNATTNGGTVKVKDCYVQATLTSDVDNASAGKQAGTGAFVGYVGNVAAKIELDNVVSDCHISGSGTLLYNYLASGDHTNATYTFKNVTYVDYADDTTTTLINSKVDTTINGTKTTVATKEFTEADWASFGVTKVASADDIATPEGWTDANGLALPTPIFDAFYTGFVGQSVTLGKELSLNIYVKTDGALAQYEGAFALGETEDDVVEVLSENVGNNIHKFTLTGIAATDMADVIAFACEDGSTCATSVQAYLVSLMDVDAELASAVLRYGAAAQTLAGDTDALVTEGIDLAPEVDTTAGLTNDATFEGDENAEYYIKGVKMFFDEGVLKLEVKCYFYSIAQQEGVEITVDGREGIVFLNYQNQTPVETETRTYTAIFSNIDIGSINDDIHLVIKKSAVGEAYSQTMTTDMDDVIADFLAGDATDAEKAFVKAMHAVGAALAD